MPERRESPHRMTTEQVSSVRVLRAGPGRETCDEAAEKSGDEPVTILTHDAYSRFLLT
jgi:hypothetical protein